MFKMEGTFKEMDGDVPQKYKWEEMAVICLNYNAVLNYTVLKRLSDNLK